MFKRIIVRHWPAVVSMLGAGIIGTASAAGQSPIAIVVYAENPMEDISLDELRRLFEGRSTRLGGISGVTLYQHTPSRERFYEQALSMTVSRATKAWIALVFSGDAAVPPIDFERASDLLEAVAGKPSALGFVPFSEVDTDLVRILRLDGRSIDDPGYPLR